MENPAALRIETAETCPDCGAPPHSEACEDLAPRDAMAVSIAQFNAELALDPCYLEWLADLDEQAIAALEQEPEAPLFPVAACGCV